MQHSPLHRHNTLPEILAPAGNELMMRAAVENGADAVYFGVQTFNARLRAANFTLEELPSIMERLHERGVKGYLTLNTLIFDGELDEGLATLRAAAAAGVDAVLIQDLGLAALAQTACPGLAIHASTQMTLSCAESAEAVATLGIELERIVVPRELNRREIAAFKEQCAVQLEVFVHGALCVAYSGQCLTSEALGGRSANRGECAQACRLPYDLIVDGAERNLDLRYLLSPMDLAAHGDVADLIGIGVTSLKIEGRLKSPEYVAATVQAYRAAVEGAAGVSEGVTSAHRDQLEATFSRGFTAGYLHSTDHQTVVDGRTSSKRGRFIGTVAAVNGNNTVTVALSAPLRVGDGILYETDGAEQGGRVIELRHGREKRMTVEPPPNGSIAVCVTLRAPSFKQGTLRAGAKVWKTSDQEIEQRLRRSFSGNTIRATRPLTMEVWAAPGSPLRVCATEPSGCSVEMFDDEPAQAATNQPLTPDVLRTHLGRLGGTPFRLEELIPHISGEPIVPLSRLNRLRRRVVDELLAVRRSAHERLATTVRVSDVREMLAPPSASSREDTVALSILCRSLAQVEAVSTCEVMTVYTDFEDLRLHHDAVTLVRQGGSAQLVPATLRIMKPREGGIVRKLLKADPDGVLIRNLASWTVLRDESHAMPFYGDYSLNIANSLSAALLMKHGFTVLTPSYDLNFAQLEQLLMASAPEWYEVTIHQHIPMFHMEHCVFCRFLSTGTDASNCGRPCEHHSVAIRDRMGSAHPLKADFACRNTVYNAIPQSASEYLSGLLRHGIRRFRIELLNETAAEAAALVRIYRDALTGKREPREIWRTLRASSKLGVTRGSLDHSGPAADDRLYALPRR